MACRLGDDNCCCWDWPDALRANCEQWAHEGCDPECDKRGHFDTINEDGRYGPLYPARLPCPNYPACRAPTPPPQID